MDIFGLIQSARRGPASTVAAEPVDPTLVDDGSTDLDEPTAPGLSRSAAGQIDPATARRLAQLFNEQEKGIQNQEGALKKYLNTPQKQDLSPLLALTDSWTGSKFSQNYDRPETVAERAKTSAQIEKYLADQKGDLASNFVKLFSRSPSSGTEINDREKMRQDRTDKRQGDTNLMKYHALVKAPETANFIDSFTKLSDELGGIDLVDGKANVPGVGPLTAFPPDFMRSDKGSRVRQLGEDLIANYQLALSGKAVTDAERASIRAIKGLGNGSKVTTFIKGMRDLRDATARRVAAAEAAGGAAADIFGNRTGGFTAAGIKRIGSRPAASAAPTSTKKPLPKLEF